MVSDNKLRMVKEIDNLNYEVCELRKENADLRQAHLFDEEEIGRLSAAAKALSKDKEDMGVSLLQVEQDKNTTIIDLRQAMAQLREELNNKVDVLKKLEAGLTAKERELNSTAERGEMEARKLRECEEEKMRVSDDLAAKMH